jgi:hypothetical protein
VRLACVKPPDAGGRQCVTVNQSGDERFQHSLGFQSRSEITTQVINFSKQVHV